jgi:branched-chain amino acid transport system permease protein
VIDLLRYVIAGLALGSLYGLLALGVSTLLRGTDIPNFAQGSFALAAAYVSWWLSMKGLFLPLALLGGVAASSLIAYLADRLAMRHMLGAPIVSLLIFTLGLQITINNGALLIWGPNTQTPPQIFPNGGFAIGSLTLEYRSIGYIVVGGAIAWLMMRFFDRTRIGISMRAVAEHRTWPSYLGVNVPSVLSLTWLVAGLLGGIGGVLIASGTFLDPTVMDSALIPAFTAGAIGGFTSLTGAYMGGLILGVAGNLAAAYISPDFKSSITFIFLLLVLIVRPQGLFTTRQERVL